MLAYTQTCTYSFYPQANTKSCTIEANNFQRDLAEYKKLNAAIVGVSVDAPGKITSFKEKYGLNYVLLSDKV